LFVDPEILGRIQPVTVGAYSDDGYDMGKQTLNYHPTAQRFEYGTQNESLFTGMKEGADFILTIGLERIIERNKMMAEKFYSGLKSINGISILSPEEKEYRSSMITFKSQSKSHGDIASYLGNKRIRVRVVNEAGLEGVRVSFHLYNNSSDVDTILNEIENFVTG
jgi:L-cysteine/cystine lyase